MRNEKLEMKWSKVKGLRSKETPSVPLFRGKRGRTKVEGLIKVKSDKKSASVENDYRSGFQYKCVSSLASFHSLIHIFEEDFAAILRLFTQEPILSQ